MVEDQKSGTLKHANELLRKGHLEQAKTAYVTLLTRRPELRSVIEFNVNLLARRQRLAGPRSNADTKIVVYTVLVGDYEAVKEPAIKDPDCTYLLFTDNPDIKSDGWTIVPFDTLGLSPRRASRLPKLLPHRYLPEHDVSVYIDASLTVSAPDWQSLVSDLLSDCNIAAYPHYQRQCVYAEITECVKKEKADSVTAEDYSECLRAEGFPENFGLLEHAFLIRRNNNEIRELNEQWHAAFSGGMARDQLYLMPLLWRRGVRWAFLEDAPQFRKSPHVRFAAHTGAPEPVLASTGPRKRINWVIGGSSSKGWAYENNAKRLIARLPEFDHLINADTHTQCAVYFDTLIYHHSSKPADHALLRLGGPNPVRRVFGDDPKAVAQGLSAFDAIIPLSAELRRLAAGASALVRMIPNGLDLSRYRPASSNQLSNGSFTIGFAANCTSEMERAFKGLDLVEDAVAITGVRLITLQKGPNQIPHDRIVPDFFHRIDCLVHPVAPGKEGCSNVIMEALACGVPVITTRASGYHGEQLIHGVDVLFCERSTDSLVDRINKLRNDRGLRQRLSRNAARFARRHHDLDNIGRQIGRVLKETVAPDHQRRLKRPKLRIAMITTTFWPKFAGMELMVHNLATALNRLGNEVVLFAPECRESCDEIHHEYQLSRCSLNGAGLRNSFFEEFIKAPFDVIYVQGAYIAATLAHKLKEEFEVPIVLRTHGEDIQVDPEIGYGLRLNPKKNAIVIDNLRRANVNVSISRHILRDALELAPGTDQRMISNGVDADHFDRPRNGKLHQRFNLPPETRILLTVGRNVRKKTFHLAIEALAMVRQKRQDVVLVHVGKDGNGENLRETAERTGVSDAFFEYGEADYFAMPEVYAGADLFVFPSKLETFGNVTIEAMAAGLPCIEFDYGANQDKILDGRNGYIVPYGDTGRMAVRILQLLGDEAAMAAFSQAARHHIRQAFDWPIIARKYHDAFLDHTLTRDRPGTLKPRLRIAFAADKMIRIKGGGGEKSLTTLVNTMAQRGHEVFLIIKELGVARHEAPFYPLHPGVTLCNIYGWGAASPPKDKRPVLLKAILEKLQPNVVVGFFLPEFGYVARGCEGLDVTLLLSHRNDPAEKLKNLTARYPTRLPHVAYADERAQVLTVQMEPYLELLPPVARPKGVVIPNSVLPVPEAMRAHPDKSASRNVILNVARLVGAKHQDLMIRAFARIAAKHPDWDIHIWGGGPLQGEIEALIDELGMKDRVFLKGTTQNILPIYRDAKIFAFPSLYEGFSRALSEAMAHGLPSVGIETCICSRTFLHESGGGIVTADEVGAFATALDRLIRSPKDRRAMGVKAQSYVARFAPARVDDLWEEVLFDAAGRVTPCAPLGYHPPHRHPTPPPTINESTGHAFTSHA